MTPPSHKLTEVVYIPWLSMRTMIFHLKVMEGITYMRDCDVGDMFLNFMLELSFYSHARVDFTPIFSAESLVVGEIIWSYYERMMFEYFNSPYFVTKNVILIERVVKRYKLNPSNIFRWGSAKLKVPGVGIYDYNCS